MSSDKSEMQSLSVTRERRVNAGSKMSQLIDNDDDEFYKTTYGGFNEEVNDNDYSTEDSDSDDVDSDFDIDENDEIISDDDNDDGKRKTRRNVYRDPLTKKSASKAAKDTKRQESREESRAKRVKLEETSKRVTCNRESSHSIGKKSFRESTKRNAAEVEARARIAREESEARKRYSNFDGGHRQYRLLTQQEMLREAKKTETLNLRSLERYRMMELERSKKSKIVKESIKGPIIRFQSVAMPLIEEIHNNDHDKDDNRDDHSPDVESNGSSHTSKCSRTFISFTDDETYKKHFPDRRTPIVRPKLFCPISHVPGRYFDPVTQLPYSNSNTFRAMREAYYKQLEQLGDMKQPEVAKWVQWRRRTAQLRQPRIIQIIK